MREMLSVLSNCGWHYLNLLRDLPDPMSLGTFKMIIPLPSIDNILLLIALAKLLDDLLEIWHHLVLLL